MKITSRHFLTLAFVIWQSYSSAQQFHYTAKETESIHDSISQSRWDVGGRLSQYSFRYMSEFFPTGIIHKSSQPYQFRHNPIKSLDTISIKSGKEKLSLEAYLKKLHVASFIVVQKGAVVYEKYFSMLPEDRHTLQSVTKVITASIITGLVNEKKIDLNQSIDQYLPELKDSDWSGISVKDILNMRSGMDIRSIDFETGPFTNPQHKNYQLESALGILPKADNTPSSVYKYIAAMKKDTVPGSEAAYSNINTFVLGWLAEKITGKKYADLVTERVWKPIGASSDAYVCLSDKGIAWPHGGMSATLRDLARFGMMFTNSEIKAKKESLISFAQVQEIFAAKPIKSPFGPLKWAYQWDMAHDGVMLKTGFGGQALYIDPEKEIVIAYYNYVDKDWGMNLISESALGAVMKTVNTDR
ncbi:serine hydrolase [Dyadobacter sp. CY312]|uniref:serine hydrolase domain-containing protein n=1 Tax=Dyadobacter sp. CY312 TaxID=2907303 RepID=UPI001F21202B|nr:serine hydrolase domain-containing protein [Dyadobacter sp. CY312]MCE7043172.1 beta-lactamase family protein [Dyadobacter sp. CY312]